MNMDVYTVVASENPKLAPMFVCVCDTLDEAIDIVNLLHQKRYRSPALMTTARAIEWTFPHPGGPVDGYLFATIYRGSRFTEMETVMDNERKRSR
jgi:hypothetical protein